MSFPKFGSQRGRRRARFAVLFPRLVAWVALPRVDNPASLPACHLPLSNMLLWLPAVLLPWRGGTPTPRSFDCGFELDAPPPRRDACGGSELDSFPGLSILVCALRGQRMQGVLLSTASGASARRDSGAPFRRQVPALRRACATRRHGQRREPALRLEQRQIIGQINFNILGGKSHHRPRFGPALGPRTQIPK